MEYLLHTRKVTWADLRWGVTASAHLPGAALRGAFDVMEQAWADVVQAGQSPDRTTPAKDSINCWVGTCGMKAAPTARVHLSFEDDPVAGWRLLDAYEIKGLFEYRRETKTLDSGSYRVVYDWCLCVEHVRLAQAHQACVAVYKAIRLPFPVLHLVVDGFIWEKPRKAVTAERLKTILGSLTFGCLPQLEEHVRTEMLAPEPKQKRFLVDLYPISGSASDEKVFRVVVPQARQHLRGEFKMEKVTRSWPVAPCCVKWDELDLEEAREFVLEGKSLLVEGLAGVGKSHFIRGLVAELEAQGKRVRIIAKTHNAAVVAGGDTADHFAWRHIKEGGIGADVIWVDEVSMLGIELLQDLNHASFREPPIQWILSGDFNQYEPFFNSFMGGPVSKSLKGSELLCALSGGNHLVMTECMRSDAFLFDWYASPQSYSDRPSSSHTRPLTNP